MEFNYMEKISNNILFSSHTIVWYIHIHKALHY